MNYVKPKILTKLEKKMKQFLKRKPRSGFCGVAAVLLAFSFVFVNCENETGTTPSSVAAPLSVALSEATGTVAPSFWGTYYAPFFNDDGSISYGDAVMFVITESMVTIYSPQTGEIKGTVTAYSDGADIKALNGRIFMSIEETNEPGIYNITVDGTTVPFMKN